ILVFIFLQLFLTRPDVAPVHPEIQTDTITVTGKACYYASKFHGRKTSSGEIFDNQKFTAAHLSLPFGTMVTVTNVSNGKSVEVKVNDRGPHTKAFIIDLSQAAAKAIGIYGKGVGKVEITYTLAEKAE